MAAQEGQKMGIAAVIVFLLGFTSTTGSKCTDISGYWQNELGSRMKLHVDDGSHVTGEYWTAVEAKPGAAAFASNITGIFSHLPDGTLLAFSVLFNHGSSLTTWVGQCTVCEDKEVLHTTYILRRYISDPQKKWISTIVNQNTFWRLQDGMEDVPEDIVALRLSTRTNSVASETPAGLQMNGKWKSNSNEEIEIRKMNRTLEGGLQFNGKWISNTKEEMEVYGTSGKELEGNNTSSDWLGAKEGHKFAAVTLLTTNGKTIRSWAGYVSDSSFSSPRVLETAWLEHKLHPNCVDPRAVVRFGMINFTGTTSDEHTLKKSETFFEKIRKFFTSMF